MNRRGFLAGTGAGLLGALAGAVPGAGARVAAASSLPAPSGSLKMGLVTYNLARSWDIPTIIKNCSEARFEGVELRTTHAHGVEVSLGVAQRAEVKRRFEDSPVELASLGSAFEFQSSDSAELRKNIEGTKEYAKLAADVGARGIKVRPNGFPRARAIPEEKTLEQIGRSLAEVGAAAADHGIEIRVEVHGGGTDRLVNMKKIMDYADHKNVFVCWNSNDTDLADGGLGENFKLVAQKIRFVHMRDLFIDYPFRELLALLKASGYDGYCCAEIPESTDPVRVMKYYRALFVAYQ